MEKILILQGITVDQLLDEISLIVSRSVTENMKSLQPPKKYEYLTRKAVCELLKITLPTLHEWTKLGLTPCRRIGTRVLYRSDDLEKALSHKKMKR